MKTLCCFVFAILLVIAAPAARATATDAVTDNEIQTFLAEPAAFTDWLEHHDAAAQSDTLVRIIKAVEKSQMSDLERMQPVAVSVAGVIRASGPAAQENLVAVARQVDARWLPVMVAAATLVGGTDGLATQKALIASYTGKDGWDAKARAAATSPAQVLGVGLAMRTATPPGEARAILMPPGWAARATAAQVIAAAKLKNPSAPVIAATELKNPSASIIAVTELRNR